MGKDPSVSHQPAYLQGSARARDELFQAQFPGKCPKGQSHQLGEIDDGNSVVNPVLLLDLNLP